MFLSDKPFACDIDGCSMKFINEDHLTCHKKRHDITLNFTAISKGSLFADQTPTPTRFIRNCEEVGLFQDLQNVNPFEETFRKAAECVKSGDVHSLLQRFPSHGPDDTLHTPNVFPNIPDINPAPPPHIITTNDLDNKAISLPSVSSPPIENSIIKDEQKNEIKEKNKIQVMMKVPGGKLVQFFAEEVEEQSVSGDRILINTDPLLPDTKTLLKEKIMRQGVQTDSVPMKLPIPKLPVHRNFNLKCFTKNPSVQSVTKRRPRSKNMTGSEGQHEMLARNRAAASRFREKKKMYMHDLESINQQLKLSNDHLVQVNTNLVEEVKKLRSLLRRYESTANVDPPCVEQNTESPMTTMFQKEFTDVVEVENYETVVECSVHDPLEIDPLSNVKHRGSLVALSDLNIIKEHCYFSSKQ